jgi:hypothetical protein
MVLSFLLDGLQRVLASASAAAAAACTHLLAS